MTDPRAPARPPFAWDAQTMRALGYRVIDDIVEHRLQLRDKPVFRRRTRADYDALFGGAPPRSGTDPDAVLQLVEQHVLTGMAHVDHPRFYGYVPGPGNYLSALGDALASGFNVFAGHCFVGSAAAAIEATTLGWLRDVVGLPASTGGIFVSGGSLANLTALHVARNAAIGPVGHDRSLVVYGTREGHSSLGKALRILGFAPDQFHAIATDDALAMEPQDLDAAIRADLSTGRRPLAVLATAGTTSTGSIDPLQALRAVCDRHGLWLHVDGAYGAATCLVPESRHELRGIELADSVVLDPHKWWFQPFEIGCVLVRDHRLLKDAFSVEAGYLREAAAAGAAESDGLSGDINFYDHGPQLTRSFRALKFWMFLKSHGLDAVAASVAHGITLARDVATHIEASADWELVTPARIGVLTFRSRDRAARSHQVIRAAVSALLEGGYALITTTEVRGETVFRLCPIHPDARLDELVESLRRLAGAVHAANSTIPRHHEPAPRN